MSETESLSVTETDESTPATRLFRGSVAQAKQFPDVMGIPLGFDFEEANLEVDVLLLAHALLKKPPPCKDSGKENQPRCEYGRMPFHKVLWVF